MAENLNNGKKPAKASIWKSLKVGLFALLSMVIIAYGFEITQVDLEELRSEKRQESLVRVTRALAKPDLIEYDKEEIVFNAPVMVPCPATPMEIAEPDLTQPYLVVEPACAAPGDVVVVKGYNFAPSSEGPLRFIPGNDPTNVVTLGRDVVETDGNGHFEAEFTLPKRESDDIQFIRATLQRNVGSPHLTRTAYDTWDKIIETVFLALLATIFGTALAIPLSFFAARNLMKPVKSPLTKAAMGLLGWPVGSVIGYVILARIGQLSDLIGSNLWVNLGVVAASGVLVSLGLRYAIPESEEEDSLPIGTRLQRLSLVVGVVFFLFLGVFQLSTLMRTLGTNLEGSLGKFGFIGYFLFQAGDIIGLSAPFIGALVAGATLGSILGKIGQKFSETLPSSALRIINAVVSSLAVGITFLLIGLLIEWLYEIGNPAYTIWYPLATGGVLGLALALLTKPNDALPVGMVIYTITRTMLNALRSVEALVMAIVFVIAVGIGPFAGVLALGLHTIVSLAKLYSEQVESILPGPLEAVEATGANRLQTIVYAVIPQIVPPYISYTMYRWDINVRMSTIIGFVGGGGIGFLLQQNINLLNYRGASAQMLAIAVVVASMDYISSVLREKTI